MSLIAQSPQSIGQILDAGFRLFRVSVLKLLPLTLVSSFASTVPQLLQPAPPAKPNFGLVFGGLAIVMLISMPIYAAVIKRLDDIAQERNQLTLGGAVAAGLRCFFPLWLASICYGLTVMVGMLLLVIPGIYFLIGMAFFAYALVLDDAGITDSLSRSRALVKGHWWRTSVILTVSGIIYLAVFLATMALLGLVLPLSDLATAAAGETSDNAMVLLASMILNTVVGAVLSPLMYCMTLATYRDLQLRKSGGDLAARIDAVA